jgi:hypothetical protein|tara:strand:+ start:101 stop:694 length:594 start_codon:yes stop_codon:yes gene_type:complete
MSAALLGAAVLCCCSSSSVAGTFFGGFIPGTSQYVLKKMKKLIQLIITDDAKPLDCENLYKYMKETKGTSAAESAFQSLSENEKTILERVYAIGRGVAPEKICDKSSVDSQIKLFKNIQEAPEGAHIPRFCNDLKDFGNEIDSEGKKIRRPIYYWDESKKEFIRDREYFSNAFDGKSGPELEGPVIAKCEAVGINIR